MKKHKESPSIPARSRASNVGTLVGTRFQQTQLSAIDKWRKSQADLPTRPEAVRRLIEIAFLKQPLFECKEISNS